MQVVNHQLGCFPETPTWRLCDCLGHVVTNGNARTRMASIANANSVGRGAWSSQLSLLFVIILLATTRATAALIPAPQTSHALFGTLFSMAFLETERKSELLLGSSRYGTTTPQQPRCPAVFCSSRFAREHAFILGNTKSALQVWLHCKARSNQPSLNKQTLRSRHKPRQFSF